VDNPPQTTADHSDDSPPGDHASDTPNLPFDPQKLAAANLDIGVFTQLLTAAQQSGLVSNTDAIITARDREFRAGRYQRAFDVIEGLYVQLNAQATRRQADLRREELQYKAGTLKMSPKEWMLRQRRATEQTQNIERARRQFARVLDGLGVLRASTGA
jgi:hypothetical protein